MSCKVFKTFCSKFTYILNEILNFYSPCYEKKYFICFCIYIFYDWLFKRRFNPTAS